MRLLLLLLIPGAVYSLDCRSPENSAEKTVCTTPALRAKNQAIERQSAELKLKLTAENAAILADTELPFLRQRNDCSNESDIPACLEKTLSQRQDLLNRAQADPNAMRDALTEANYIDIGFLRKYWSLLVGRKVSVYGCITPGETAPRIHAELETENQPAVPLLFKSMPDEIAEFLDDQKPCAHWLVTVRKQGDKFLLYADEVLGRPLP